MRESPPESIRYGEVRDEVRRYGQELLREGLTSGTGGNLSRRTDDGHLAISPSGIPYDQISCESVPIIDRSGDRIHGTEAPSVEAPMHTAIYRRYDDVGAVVHTHSPYASAYAVSNRAIPPSHYLIARIGDEVPVAEYATFGTEKLGRSVVETLGREYEACLLQNHGVLAVGETLGKAVDVAKTVEFCARVHYHASAIGDPSHLSSDELDDLQSKFEGYGEY